MIASGTHAEDRIRRDRTHLVPMALLQGATAQDVACALGDWPRDELTMAIGRWAHILRRQGLIAPAELDALLAIDAKDVPEDPIRSLGRSKRGS
jgi:hypothetical protein